MRGESGSAVNVYLLLVNDEEFFFYSDDSEVDESDLADRVASSGIWTRLTERWLGLQKNFRAAEAGVVGSVRRVWNWLHSRVRPDEAMLARLRSTRRVDLHHPSSNDPSSVETIWRTYLRQRYWRHLLHALVNGAIALPTILCLWFLPGPNVIGYWFVYRTIHHLMTVRGISKVQKGFTPTRLHAMSALDLRVVKSCDGTVTHTVFKPEGKRLAGLLAPFRHRKTTPQDKRKN